MAKGFDITIGNKLVTEKRDMNVYFPYTRSARMINHDNSVTLSSSIDTPSDRVVISDEQKEGL